MYRHSTSSAPARLRGEQSVLHRDVCSVIHETVIVNAKFVRFESGHTTARCVSHGRRAASAVCPAPP